MLTENVTRDGDISIAMVIAYQDVNQKAQNFRHQFVANVGRFVRFVSITLQY